MSRPKKARHVQCSPDAVYFKPRAIPLRILTETMLEADELEALRLADMEGCYHKEAALRMMISRQTFGTIVKSARRKIADALVNGKAIRLKKTGYANNGGYAFACEDCGETWDSADTVVRPGSCPHCSSRNFTCSFAAWL